MFFNGTSRNPSQQEDKQVPHVYEQHSDDEYESASEHTPSMNQDDISSSSTDPILFQNPNRNWRNLTAFWLLGLTNNFAYVIMLSAAHDILSEDFNDKNVTMSKSNETIFDTPNPRDCNTLSTGAILLADIIPALVIKMIAPFIGSFVHFRVGITVLLCSLSFLLVGLASSSSMAILGVIFASASSGLGETTFLAYSSYFDRDVISTWSSGTGGAGLFGSLSYAGLTSLGLSSRGTVLLMLIIPVIMSLSFWNLLEHPSSHKFWRSLQSCYYSNSSEDSANPEEPEEVTFLISSHSSSASALTFDDKLRIIPSLFKYMLPLSLVYVAEYLINQGLSELIYFPKDATWISHNEQYRWYQVLYSLGVLISRSSVNIVYIHRIWMTSVLQWINVVIFLTAAIYWWMGSVWVAFILILWEGLLGGAAYVNTFYKLSKEVIPENVEFAMQTTCLSDTFGITIAGFIAIPMHNAICNLPL